MITAAFFALQKSALSEELPFGLSNPYEEDDIVAEESLPKILHDLGLSADENGAGFVVDIIARKKVEKKCNDIRCKKFNFSQAKDLIDLVVGRAKADLWIVIGSPSRYKFTDGKERSAAGTYLPEGPISRQAYKDYLAALVNYVTTYGRQVSGDPDWHVVRWNLYNEVVAEYKKNYDGDMKKATAAYADFVIDSAEVLRRLSPQSKIVLAGAGSGTDLQGNHGEFYRLVFSKLKQASLSYEPFHCWESHWFGRFNDYRKNEAGFGVRDFIAFLRANGYGDKEFVIRAGATYSGQDLRERKRLMDNYQSEEDQAEYLIKKFIYNIAAGAKMIPWSTIFEHKTYQGSLHVHFNYTGLIYNGIPDGVSEGQRCAKGWFPCPDPGEGVKKLSYYTYKLLIEKLKGSNWGNIQTIQEKDGVYVYKFIKESKSIWVAWNDNAAERQITISDITSQEVKITEAIPKYGSGREVTDYNTAFNTETKLVNINSSKVSITLKDKPVFVEGK